MGYLSLFSMICEELNQPRAEEEQEEVKDGEREMGEKRKVRGEFIDFWGPFIVPNSSSGGRRHCFFFFKCFNCYFTHINAGTG